ncbi:MAG TPA: UPF0182 family protein, partial [Actinomycetes bacterium]|nr:UPF0182 family protein [Actinomycetes bacterium]
GLVGAVIPAVVERYVVAPNPLLSQQPFLQRSLEATSVGLGLDAIEVQPYSSAGEFSAADFTALSDRLKNVPAWDGWVLGSRMRELVTETPYYRPDHPTFDVTRIDGRRQPTLVSPRELDLRSVPADGGKWINDRVAFTHGLGLIRFSGMETDRNGEPRLLDPGLGVREPRIYFGNLPKVGQDPEPGVATPATDVAIAESPWVLVGTRRPEVDIPAPDGAPRASYHYSGSGGIPLSSWTRRAAFALALGSKELLLSDDITPDSRIILHRDVSDRLHTLAPFIHWDAEEVPLTANGRIVFVVDGYSTSNNYPYAEQVDLGDARVNYARASVRATVDAYSGSVKLYLTDESEPIARAWAEMFPSLFRPVEEMPVELRQRLRYPADLFDAQATAYERFHTTRPDLFVSHADEWSRPTALSGPVEVAGDVDFDESDEDDLRRILPPSYKFAPPPGHTGLRIVLETFYTPRSGQNLVGDLAGWVDHQGRARLAARNLQREPATLGPAQMSRIVFATSRVRNLLGLRNLEIRDLDKSSLDAVLLGNPRVFLLSGGVVQLQSLYEGSRGPGAARMLGVTAFLNGRAGLGPDIDSALRQALNEPPQVDMLRPEGPLVVGKPIDLPFRVENGRRAVVTILSEAGRQSRSVGLANGRRTVRWVPSVAGATRVRIEVAGLDGTSTRGGTAFRVLSPRPTIRVVNAPRHAVVGRAVRVLFKLTDARRGWAKIYTRSGTLVSRRYLVRGHAGVVRWTPRSAGSALFVIGARGGQGQIATRTVRIAVRSAPEASPTPTMELLQVPDVARVGRPSEVRFRAEECRVAIARIEGPDDDVHTWRFSCPADSARFDWTPKSPGRYLLTALALGRDMQTQTATWLRVEQP